MITAPLNDKMIRSSKITKQGCKNKFPLPSAESGVPPHVDINRRVFIANSSEKSDE